MFTCHSVLRVAFDTEQQTQGCNRQADQACGSQIPGSTANSLSFSCTAAELLGTKF